MRTSTLPSRRPAPWRALAAAALTACLLAACGDDDPALTDARPIDDVPVGEDGATDATPQPDVPGVTEAIPSDDIATEQGAERRVPPLLDVVDDWPETTVTLDGTTTIVAKVAADGDRRRQGLMNVPDLPDGVGMLFLFDEPRTGGFWMKDTLVPLDIAYVLDGEVVAVLQMDPCEADPCPTYDPETEYDAALEVGQGVLAEVGVHEGSTVTWTDPVGLEPA
ncbi:DUF192 domain-containing protein [Nitriliruptor alkaliphilus]|uniref:DUF192 domain-containing protein n=1 Tax=Nitriliruptor alkaliphilus TaxID=427918 RepID=UPI000698B379|nr:DUF192 domain-containing protein [Nitriliruptor alkaliphilus]